MFVFPPACRSLTRCRVFTFAAVGRGRGVRFRPGIVGGTRHDRGVLPPRCLHESDRGSWRVTTQTSAHHLNLDARTVTRIDGAGVPRPGSSITVSALRLDRESVELIELVRCQVGAEMELLLRVRDDAVTVRRTTPVVAINPE